MRGPKIANGDPVMTGMKDGVGALLAEKWVRKHKDLNTRISQGKLTWMCTTKGVEITIWRRGGE